MSYRLPDGREVTLPAVIGPAVIRDPLHLPPGSRPVQRAPLEPGQRYGAPREEDGAWVVPAESLPIETLRARRKQAMSDARDAALAAGFDHDGHHYATDAGARAELMEVAMGFQLGLRTTVHYQVDGQSAVVSHDATSWGSVMGAYADHKESIWTRFVDRASAVAAASTAADLEAVTWEDDETP